MPKFKGGQLLETTIKGSGQLQNSFKRGNNFHSIFCEMHYLHYTKSFVGEFRAVL